MPGVDGFVLVIYHYKSCITYENDDSKLKILRKKDLASSLPQCSPVNISKCLVDGYNLMQTVVIKMYNY